MRKFIFTLLGCLCISPLFSQNKIIGFVKDMASNKPLPFATILINNSISVITDAEGKFEITLTNETKEVKVSYLGFETQKISLTPQTNFYQVNLNPKIENLAEVTVYARDNAALRLLKKAVAKQDENNPDKKANNYRYDAYEKILVTANLDSVARWIDQYAPLSEEGIFSKADSVDFQLINSLKKNHLYISEKISTVNFTKKAGRSEEIKAYRMGGFKVPVYEVLAVDLLSLSWYKPRYTLLGTEYRNPFSPQGLKDYYFQITDTILVENRPGYVINFRPQNADLPGGMQGTLFIDTQSLALQRVIIQVDGGISIKATQDFTYLKVENLWFPASKGLVIRQGDANQRIELLGGGVSYKPENATDSLHLDAVKSPTKLVYFTAKTTVNNLEVNQSIGFKPSSYDIVLEKNADKLSDSEWQRLRPEPGTARDTETYRVLDSLVKAEKVEKKINLARKVLAGWYPTKYIDWDLRTLVKYNNFEGFRTGLGFLTNEIFSKRFRLEGYGVYGFKDTSLKYSFGGAVKVFPETNTWAGINWVDDLQEVGNTVYLTDQRIFSLFEPRLFNIELFYDTQILSAFVEYDFSPQLFSKFQISTGDFFTKFDYTYRNDGKSFNFYQLGTITWSFQYNPFSRFVKTNRGKLEVKQGFPKFSLQLTKSIDGFLSGDFNFFKAEGRVLHEIKHLDHTTTTFLFEAGWGTGDIPLTHLYHASPNNPTDSRILKRFSVTGRNSFETMFFNEFFSDKYAAFHLKHKLNRFNITKKFRPELTLISRAAIGDVSNTQKHIGIDFKSLQDGFLESGFELNKLYKGFGLSFFYRYGPNKLPNFDDNLSFKFTYYFSFGL